MAVRGVLGRTAHLDGGLGVVAGCVPLLLGQLQQLLDALLQVPVRLAQPSQRLELPHLGYPAPGSAPFRSTPRGFL